MDSHTDIADSDEGDFVQQRSSVRDSLFLLATLSTSGPAGDISVRVRNLSAGGMMVETPTPLGKGETVVCELRGIGRVGGRIAWSVPGRLGVMFDHPVDPRDARKPVGGASSPRR